MYVTWPGMLHDVDYIRKHEMSEKKFTGPYVKTPFQETDTQYRPWGKLDLDIVGPLPVMMSHKYVNLSR